jgi:hypothetical protein
MRLTQIFAALVFVCGARRTQGIAFLAGARRDEVAEHFEAEIAEHFDTEAAEEVLELVDIKPAVVHSCPCAQKPERRDLRKLRWLHIPKTGTSFWATLFSYACRKKRVDLDVSPYLSHACDECYDFALKERYPATEYCEGDSFSEARGMLSYAANPKNGMKLYPRTDHVPLGPQDHPSRTVAFFRSPRSRLQSAAAGRHMKGFGEARYKDVVRKCFSNGTDARCFADYPGIKGCMARMLTGLPCADEGAASGHPAHVDVKRAVAMVKQLKFVGLTEEWNDAVCLFHAMFGGTVRQEEFKNFHPTRKKPSTSVDDELDEPVYAAAKERFRALQKQYGAEKCHRTTPASGCVPRRCEDAGAECGTIDDGCGNELSCGSCPQYRAGRAVCRATSCVAQEAAPSPGTFAVSSFHGV